MESFAKNERKIVHQKMAIPNPAKKRSCIGRAPMELFLDHQEMSSSIVQSRNGAARKFLSEHAHKTWFRPDRVAACDRQSSPRFNAGKNVIILGRKPIFQTIFVKEKSICECNTIGNLSNSSISQCVLGNLIFNLRRNSFKS